MELLYLIGFFVAIWVIGWIFKVVGEFLEIRKYKIKLKKITPQLEAMNIEALIARFSEIKSTYSELVEHLQNKYKIYKEKEQVKTITQYVNEEAKYRRGKRKPAKRTHRKKYWQYTR